MGANVRDVVADAKQFYLQHAYEEAEEMFRAICRENDGYADVYNMLGVIYHHWSRFADATQAFEKALEINPQYTEALLNLAVLYNDLGEYKQAKRLYTQLRKNAPAKKGTADIEPVLRGKLSNKHAEIGDIYYNLGLYEQAIGEYQHALDLNPTYVDILTKLGIAQRDNGQSKASATTLKSACKLNGKYQQARVQLGVTYYTMGKSTEAKKEWQTTLDSNPDNTSAKMYMSLCEK